MALPSNVRLGREGTNTLAYCVSSSLTEEKSFITSAAGEQDGVCHVRRGEGLQSPLQTDREEPEGGRNPGGNFINILRL
jgi:hypothetical protein